MRAGAAKHILMMLENNPYPQDGRVRREARALVDAGYDVTVLAPRAEGQPPTEVVDGVGVMRYRLPPERDGVIGFFAEYAVALVNLVLLSLAVFIRRGFAAVHVHNPPDLLVLAGGWYRLAGARFVFDHHDLTPEMYHARFGSDANPTLASLLRLFERLTFRSADRVLAANESYAEVARTRGGVAADRITVVRNGPDPKRVRLVAPDPDLADAADFVLGYVGELAPQDGVDHLVRAVAVLADDLGRDDFVCVIIGDGSERVPLQALAKDLGVDDIVRFTGHIDDPDELMRLLSATDICVVPDPQNDYTDRSTMIKVAEYMALGKPVVAFDLTENRRTAGDAATYAAPNEVDDLARHIADLMDDPERRADMGEHGRVRVAESLSWEHQARALVEAYAEMIGPAEELER